MTAFTFQQILYLSNIAIRRWPIEQTFHLKTNLLILKWQNKHLPCHVLLIFCGFFLQMHQEMFMWCALFSAIVEHTKQVIYLEDDDVAAVSSSGELTIHRMRRITDPKNITSTREIIPLDMEVEQIRKGENAFVIFLVLVLKLIIRPLGRIFSKYLHWNFWLANGSISLSKYNVWMSLSWSGILIRNLLKIMHFCQMLFGI